MSFQNDDYWEQKMPATGTASPAAPTPINQKLHQLHQLLNDFESCFALLDMYPELATCKDPENDNMLPLHTAMMVGAPTTSIMVLLEASPDVVKIRDLSENTPLLIGMMPAFEHLMIESIGRFKNPLSGCISILNNLNFIIDSFPEVAQQKDGKGILPLNIFCRSFIPALTNINWKETEQREVMDTVTVTFEKMYEAYPPAAEIVGPLTGSPISMLEGQCVTAQSIEELLNHQTILRLKILIRKARDGRRLQTLFSLENTVSLWAFFALFDHNEILKESNFGRRTIFLDLNQEYLLHWSLLDILADFDTTFSANALLQIVVEQEKKLNSEDQHFVIKNEDGHNIFEFTSLTKVSDTIKTRIADRAKLSNSSQGLKRWGEEYGRFLRKYRLEKRPKHISESCVVVFGTEAIRENDGRITENPVALKFMATRETFCNEVYKRREVEKKTKIDSKFVIPIKACFSSTAIDEFDCKKVNLASELNLYPEIKLKGSDLKYIVVMDCGAGYDLHDFISHQNVAGEDLLVVASIAKEIALCLKFLNEICCICHGDVKARNFVGRGVGLVGFAAIDMDNSSFIGREIVGKKRTSSGYLPPEQAAVIAFERSIRTPNSISPSKKATHGIMENIDAVRSRNGSMLKKPQIKPKDVIASPQYDMWCFGALLYFLCTGKHLFNVDMKEDVDDEDLIILRDWDNNRKCEKLSKVDSKWPVSLLSVLLQKEPKNRPENWKYVVDELNRLGSTEHNYDRLMVFQSAPLIFKDRNNNIQPLPRVDFGQESNMLREALKDAEKIGCTIDVVFETASLDRINAFLAQGLCQVMHFSGHGHPRYIALEDEKGSLEMINSDSLKRLLGPDNGLLLVFFSCCHSEWMGEAFIDAGVPHAVCCLNALRIQDVAAIEFTRNFYRALACQCSLSKAFNIAQQAVKNSPHILNPEVEANKFILLPKKPKGSSYHDVPVFFSSEKNSVHDKILYQTRVIGLPKCKDFLIGREVQQYSILNSLSTNDIVRVYGKRGFGKKAIVTTVCGHILRRPRSYSFDFVFWFPSKGSMNSVFPLYRYLSSFLTLIIDKNDEIAQEDSELKEIWHSITEIVSIKSSLLVIDLRDYHNSDRQCLYCAIDELLKISTTGCLKIILISENVSTEWNPIGGEKHVPIWELCFDSAVTLFAHNVSPDLRRRHPLLNSPEDFVNYICYPPEEIQTAQDYEKREEDLWKKFGDGIPSACIEIAKHSSDEEILRLLRWWDKPSDNELSIPLNDLFL